MTQEACEMLQRERNTIRGAKQILTKLRGDDIWIPCGSLDSDVDDMIFDTSKVLEECIRLRPSSKATRHEDDMVVSATTLLPLEDNVEETLRAERVLIRDMGEEDDPAPLLAEASGHKPTPGTSIPTSLSDKPSGSENSEKINNTTLASLDDTTVKQDFGVSGASSIAHPPQSEAHGALPFGSPQLKTDRKDSITNENTEAVATLGTDHTDGDQTSATAQIPQTEENRNPQTEETHNASDELPIDAIEDTTMTDTEGAPSASNGLQPMTHRMTTRAQAQAASDNTTSSRTRSPSVASSLLPSIHPLFLTPSGACPDRDLGLPPDEAEATRRILMSYIQKQEEVCRGAEKLYNGFLKAQRMKKNVLDSCKAEGHLDEMSDGEDWYDKEEWGLEEDLRKGHDEEEDDVGTQHKKTRGRRA
ncbi:MAG: hypothetical protein Q9172_005957 [Xanthocarpia lactea]